MIYFIQHTDGGPIKIGTSSRLSERVAQLTSEHGELIVLAVFDGGFPAEQALHRKFSHLRGDGEWFEPGGDLMEFISSNGRRWNGLDERPATLSIKLEMDVAKSARIVAALREITMTDLLSGMLRDSLARMEEEEINKRAKQSKPKGPKS